MYIVYLIGSFHYSKLFMQLVDNLELFFYNVKEYGAN